MMATTGATKNLPITTRDHSSCSRGRQHESAAKLNFPQSDLFYYVLIFDDTIQHPARMMPIIIICYLKILARVTKRLGAWCTRLFSTVCMVGRFTVKSLDLKKSSWTTFNNIINNNILSTIIKIKLLCFFVFYHTIPTKEFLS